MATEEQLIDRIHRRFSGPSDGVRVGIGDDAAVMAAGKGTEWVVTTDTFLENVHFLRKVHPPKAVGYKALARATSDIAAMGARPRYFLLAVAVPADCTGAWVGRFLDGMTAAARRFGLTLIGGDTTKYPSILINLTVIGETRPGRAILRSGANPGDLICVSGTLGEAELGLRLVQRGFHNNKDRRWKKFLAKHFTPEPRLALGRWLADHRYASAMIDTSDGLSTDLAHICKASGVGAKVYAAKVPTVKVPPGLRPDGLDPLQLGVHGGEDYELLFTVPKRMAARLRARMGGARVTAIGEITRGRGIMLVDNQGLAKPLRPGGWEPFRSHRANRGKL